MEHDSLVGRPPVRGESRELYRRDCSVSSAHSLSDSIRLTPTRQMGRVSTQTGPEVSHRAVASHSAAIFQASQPSTARSRRPRKAWQTPAARKGRPFTCVGSPTPPLTRGRRWRRRYFSGATAGQAASLDRARLAHMDQVRTLCLPCLTGRGGADRDNTLRAGSSPGRVLTN